MRTKKSGIRKSDIASSHRFYRHRAPLRFTNVVPFKKKKKEGIGIERIIS